MKLKRFLTGVLSAVMALSVCALPAAAAESQVTFDVNKNVGSLTITKLEQTQTQSEAGKGEGSPLAGVTFTAYKIADISQSYEDGKPTLAYDLDATLKNKGLDNGIFNGNSNGNSDMIDKNTGLIDSKLLYDEINKTFSTLTADEKAAMQKGDPQKTNDAGVASFTELPLGIYMIEETAAPSQILTRTANFVVSIPMVQTTENGQEWVYDVEASPKNVATYGGVSLVKTGTTAGSRAKAVAVPNVLFRLDKETSDGVWEAVDLNDAIRVTAGKNSQTEEATTKGYLTTSDTGTITIESGLAPGKYRFVEISASNGYVANTDENANIFTVEKDSEGKLVTKVGGQKVESVSVTNEKPDLDKNVADRKGDTTNNGADYAIGDAVPYTLTIYVPANIAKMATFKVVDTVKASQQAYNEGSFKVTYNGGTDGADIDIPADKYAAAVITTDAAKDVSSFTIDFKPKGADGKVGGLDEAFAGKAITITYTTTLKDGAVTDKSGNINKAQLSYSNKTDIGADGKEIPNPGNPYEIHNESVVYTFQTGIYKVNESNAAMQGVTFALYKAVDETTDKETTWTDNSDEDGRNTKTGVTFAGKNIEYASADEVKAAGLNTAKKWIKVYEKESDANGKITYKGLPNGVYKWVETKTQTGYNLLKEPVDATLNVNYKAEWTEGMSYSKDGKLIKRTYDETNTTYDNAAAEKSYTVVNRRGFQLPVTGGFGTLLFSGIGVLLVLAGVAVLFSMKKKNDRA
ncbi:SpaH/EbpB family LPXTG-anchored major pilin [uncultured Gemmiger sp.]|uniref:SpaH/EbpB family LPXTG-anchored major pilin n=1 Tax=uncultured Gemmiger sp. TaxID=1623490 RepID=UPI0025DC6558|nr:SpaH/EbpB family LPXTG-anchored major pilin [uncultured Gemmiger sp.]